jgi:hypothetical protein
MSKTLLRSCPLLERAAESQSLPYAPFPWSLRRCADTGFVYLANPPAQDLFRDTFAWEVTHKTESRRRQQAEPAVHAMSEAVKTFRRRVLKRDKVATLGRRIACTFGTGPIRLVDVGCAEGTLIERIVAGIPADVAGRVEPIGIEISDHLASVAGRTLSRRGGRCIHATGIEGLAMLEPASVHMIVLSCILEHEIEPLKLLRHCRQGAEFQLPRPAGPRAKMVRVSLARPCELLHRHDAGVDGEGCGVRCRADGAFRQVAAERFALCGSGWGVLVAQVAQCQGRCMMPREARIRPPVVSSQAPSLPAPF